MKLSIRHKVGLLSISLVALTAATVAFVFYQNSTTFLTEQALENMSNHMQEDNSVLKNRIQSLREDVLFLAGTPPIQGIVRAHEGGGVDVAGSSSTQQWVNRLTSIFNILLHSKPYYFQARYLDAMGNELVRVERQAQHVITVPAQKLQNKRDHDYVKETIKLANEKVYLSEINLNIEHGRVAVPHLPILRAATPVYGETGKVVGIVIINMDFGQKLERIEQSHSLTYLAFYIANDQGDYLLHPDQGKTFGFDLGTRYTIQEEFPHLAAMFTAGIDSTALILSGKSDQQQAMVSSKLAFDPDRPERFIVTAITRPYSDIIVAQNKSLSRSVWISLLLILIGTLLAYAFATRIVNPIKQIQQGIDDFINGRTGAALPVKKNDEIGALARAFENLTGQVRESQQNLQDLNANLETIVQKRTEELAEFKGTLDMTLDCVFMFYPDTLKFFYFNKGAINQLGYEGHELVNMTPIDIKPGFTEPRFREIIAPLIEGILPVLIFETIHQHKNGALIPVEIFLQYVRPRNEEPRFVAIVHDITERKHAAEKLQKNATIIKLLQQVSSHANKAKNFEDAIQYCLHKICAYTGWDIGHAYIRDPDDVNRLKPTDMWYCMDEERFASFKDITKKTYFESNVGLPGRVWANEKPVWITDVSKDTNFLRSTRRLNVEIITAFAFPVFAYGEVAAVLEFYSRDLLQPDKIFLRSLNQLGYQLGHVIEREQNHKKLIQTKDAAEQANKAKSRFIARMSHELRTPMNAILGFGQLLEMDDEPPLVPKHKEQVQEILKAGNHLLELINEVLDLSRIETGRINIDYEVINCEEFMSACLTLISPLANKRGLTIHYDVSQFAEVNLHADPTRLKEIMLNLLSNAVKYNSDKGALTLACEVVAENRVRLSISDTGQGLSDEQILQLFQPFERLGAEFGDVQGTGIGLVICKHIIEAMGGDIGIEATPGKGSTFWIELNTLTSEMAPKPQSDPNVVNIASDANNNKNNGKQTVLYIEDNLANLRLVEHLFKKYPWVTLISALIPEEGLLLARAQRPDLILTDIQLPGMDGFEVLEHLKSCKETQVIPVVAVSAKAMPGDIEKGRKAGFIDYITKPIEIARFHKVIGQLLEDVSGDGLQVDVGN